MTITKKTFRIALAIAAIASAGWLVGCGGGNADNQADASSTADPNAEEQTQETEQDLEARQREVDERLAAVAEREAEVAQREAATKRSATTQRTDTTQAPVARAPRTSPPPAEPVSRTVSVTLPASTALEVEFAQSLSSEESMAGDPVRAVVVQDVIQDGMVVVPAGSEVRGQVVEARAVKKIGGQAKLAMAFDTLRMPGGDEMTISSSIEFLGKKQTGKDAATIGGSAAGGAILGRVLGGDDKDKNTAIGAVVGAAVGTAVAANNKTDPVLVESGQATQLLLQEPVRVSVVREASPSSLATR